MVFTYYIVPGGEGVRPALVKGSLYTADVESAKRHVRTVSAHRALPQSGLEVILQDAKGTEIWRGSYLGSADA